MNTRVFEEISNSWKYYWANKRFRVQVIIGSFILFLILLLFSTFLNYIEQRKGIVLNDWLLNQIPSIDVSIPVFAIIWLSVMLFIFRAIKDPSIFITFLWCYIFLMFSRMLTIYLVPLDPPRDLIPLVDPLINKTFYDGVFITKDLFYSGHTATILLMSFCLKKSLFKKLTLIAAICIGIMVLLQHIHYTVDVATAPFFTAVVYWLGRKFVEKSIV
ncbi:MAG: hypothetical protein KGZ59_07525 [Chitinophagaceae bacterium]|nr:hypothetical protein [Chitinophagaceae bacterium]